MVEVSEREKAVEQPNNTSDGNSLSAQQHSLKVSREKQDLKELDTIIEELTELFELCNEALSVCADLKQQEAVQSQLKTYSSGLVGVPVTLQHLNDFRRLIPQVVERAQQTRQDLITVRGGDEDALVSEEARILSSCEQTKEFVLQTIQSLEFLLSQIRETAPPLLAAISYTNPGFESFAPKALAAIRIDLVATALNTERERLRILRADIHDVYMLKEHAASLL